MRTKSFALLGVSLGLAFLAIWFTATQTSRASASPSLVKTLAALPSSSQAAVAQATLTLSPTDIVLVLSAAESQAYDAPSGQAYTGDPAKSCNPTDVGGGNVNACIQACNQANDCHPFVETKNAAKAFIDQMRRNHDRVAVVSYHRAA